jgi:hypothetical protein
MMIKENPTEKEVMEYINNDSNIHYIGNYLTLKSYATASGAEFLGFFSDVAFYPIKKRGRSIQIFSPYGEVREIDIKYILAWAEAQVPKSIGIGAGNDYVFEKMSQIMDNLKYSSVFKIGKMKFSTVVLDAKKIANLDTEGYSKIRQKYKKFMNFDSRVEYLHSGNKIDAYYILEEWKEKALKRGMPRQVVIISHYKNLIEASQGKGDDYFCFIVYREKKPIGLVYCHDTGNGYFSNSITMGDNNITGLNEYMYNTLAKWAVHRGWRYLNSGNSSTKGLLAFKKKWGIVKEVQEGYFSIKFNNDEVVERDTDEYF